MGKVLIACEESQAVTKEMRALGIEAYSCDIEPCSGGHPVWHIQGDVTPLLKQEWDLIIAHPPCTRLSNSGVFWLDKRNLWKEMYQACEFFNLFQTYAKYNNCKVAIENPIPHKYAKEYIGNYSQIVQPYMFGHTVSKATCFWLYGLPELKETDNVFEVMKKLPKNEQQRMYYLPPGKERAKLRSKTFSGIAKAMASQWGVLIS
jgi:hypothetical protein